MLGRIGAERNPVGSALLSTVFQQTAMDIHDPRSCLSVGYHIKMVSLRE